MQKNHITRAKLFGSSEERDWSRCAFTLVELLVVIAIIALLIAITVPVLSKTREKARRITCASQLSSCAQVLILYGHDHNGQLPVRDTGGGFWTDYIFPDYLSETNILTCPTEMAGAGRLVQNDPGPDSTYWYGGGDTVDAGGTILSQGVDLSDLSTSWVLCDYWYTGCHEDGKNVLFLDGHVSLVPVEEVKDNTGEFPAP